MRVVFTRSSSAFIGSSGRILTLYSVSRHHWTGYNSRKSGAAPPPAGQSLSIAPQKAAVRQKPNAAGPTDSGANTTTETGRAI